jgi:hypothetical protein
VEAVSITVTVTDIDIGTAGTEATVAGDNIDIAAPIAAMVNPGRRCAVSMRLPPATGLSNGSRGGTLITGHDGRCAV